MPKVVAAPALCLLPNPDPCPLLSQTSHRWYHECYCPVVPCLGQVWTLSTNALEGPFPSAKTTFPIALLCSLRERSLQKQGNTPAHLLPTHSTPAWLFAQNAVFHFLKAKTLNQFPSILPDPPCTPHKDPLLPPSSLFRWQLPMGITSGTVNVFLLMRACWSFSEAMLWWAVMSCLLFPSIPAIPPGSSSGMASQSSGGVLKVKVIVMHVNKIYSLKWGILIILMHRREAARGVGNTTVGDSITPPIQTG